MATGYLILLIASIVIAGIAAIVLIQMGISLQSQAIHTADKSQEEITSAIDVTSIYAEDGTNPVGSLRYFYATIKPKPGSPGIKLDLMSIQGDFEEATAQLKSINLSESFRNCT